MTYAMRCPVCGRTVLVRVNPSEDTLPVFCCGDMADTAAQHPPRLMVMFMKGPIDGGAARAQES